jgi:hypothetical protein
MVVAAEAPPLTADATGVFRMGNSRVTLDTVVGAFRDGATAEMPNLIGANLAYDSNLSNP